MQTHRGLARRLWSVFVPRASSSAVRTPPVNRCRDLRRLAVESLELRQLLAADLLITEFMADNDDNIGLGEVERVFGKPDPFEDGSSPDWIEIHNSGDEAVDLQGFHLTDDPDDLAQWTFPSTIVEPGGYLLVFASGDGDALNPYDEFGNLHTNFGLRSRGDYLALVAPDRTTVVSDVTSGANFPQQVSNVSYGLTQSTSMLTPESSAMYWIPQHGDLGTSWTRPEFDAVGSGFSSGRSSLGYETRPTNRTNFDGLFETELPEGTAAVYLRTDFFVDNVADVSQLLLRLRYDNGMIAYLNGVEVARANVPDDSDWSSVALSTSRRDSASVVFEDIELSHHLDLLKDGKNTLAIHLMNHPSDSSDLLLAAQLVGDKPLADASVGYLMTPTPGAANAFVDAFDGPSIGGVTENPGALDDAQDLLVTARVEENNASVNHVTLHYRVMFEEEHSLAMVDDGTGGDATPDDGVYSALIPSSMSDAGQMIRWRVVADDSAGRTTRWPLYPDARDSDEYFGTMIRKTVESNLPVLNWFIDDSNLRSAGSDVGGQGALFFRDQFYDNIWANAHGQSTRNFPKRSYDLDFNQGNRFEWQEGEARVRDINLVTNWGDKAKFRHALAYDMYRDAQSPAFFAFPVRVERNGEFFSVADLIEDADDRTLERIGLNPDGALYKMYDGLNSVSSAEKKSREWEDTSDLLALRDGTRLQGDDWPSYAFDNIDVPAIVNFLPLFDLQNNKGCCHKNYYLYRDTGLTDEWQMIIWDPDLAFGHDFKAQSGYFDDVMDWDNPLFSTRGTNNSLLRKLYSPGDTPGFNEMYMRRLRTLMDEFLQPSDTPYAERYLEQRIDEYIALIDPHDDPFDPMPEPLEWPEARHGTVLGTDDADLDYNAWGSWDHANGGRLHAARGETMREHAQRIKDEYLNQRRDFLYGLPDLPAAQVGNPVLHFDHIEADPVSADSSEQFIELSNRHDTAVDISGWRLTQGVDFEFPPGTVIPSGWTLYVVADKNSFRSREVGPSGGHGLFIVGGWDGVLESDETLTLVGRDGETVNSAVVSQSRLIGDSNADGLFNSSDLVAVFTAGKYEDEIPNNATFEEGDWNQDGDFDSADLVHAMQSGQYANAAVSVSAESESVHQIAAAVEWYFAQEDDHRRKNGWMA